MPNTPEAALVAARRAVANPDARTPLSVRQMNWGLLKAARDQSVDLARLDPLARASAQVMTPAQRRTNAVLADLEAGRDPVPSRVTSRAVKSYCDRTGHPYFGPFGGDAA